jgi:hypothetical protein
MLGFVWKNVRSRAHFSHSSTGTISNEEFRAANCIESYYLEVHVFKRKSRRTQAFKE